MRKPAQIQQQRPRRSGRVALELVRPDSPLTGAYTEGPPTPTSATVRPDLTSQVEKFHEVARELPPLFERHYREIAMDQDLILLDPDWDRYFWLSLNGMLIVRTARCDGTLVGYIFNLVGPHLHYRSTPHAEIEMFWLDPAYRGSFFALRWFRENEAHLRELGIKKVGVATKNGYMGGRVGLIFTRLGYSPVETVWSKVL
jgi:GNAT superfamily N-acetyltransferase